LRLRLSSEERRMVVVLGRVVLSRGDRGIPEGPRDKSQKPRIPGAKERIEWHLSKVGILKVNWSCVVKGLAVSGKYMGLI